MLTIVNIIVNKFVFQKRSFFKKGSFFKKQSYKKRSQIVLIKTIVLKKDRYSICKSSLVFFRKRNDHFLKRLKK